MENQEKMYHLLFNAMTDALSAPEQQTFGMAGKVLRAAQLASKELYMTEAE